MILTLVRQAATRPFFVFSAPRGTQADLADASEDLEAACSRSLAHGSLLALRYLAPALPWALLEVRSPCQPSLTCLGCLFSQTQNKSLLPVLRPPRPASS